MRITRRHAITPALAVASLFTGLVLGQADASSDPTAAGPDITRSSHITAANPSLISDALELKRTYLNRGQNSTAVSMGTWTAVEDAMTINCPGKGSCVVTADLNIQLAATDGSNIELCPRVDGDADPTQLPCSVNIGVGNSGGYEAYHFIHTFKVSSGNHKVRAWILSGTSAASLAWFSDVYSVYKKAG